MTMAIAPTHADTLWQIASALAVILTILATHLRSTHDRKRKQAATEAQVAVVQETVNGRTDTLSARVNQLGEALTSAGVEIPPPTAADLAAASEQELRAALQAKLRNP